MRISDWSSDVCSSDLNLTGNVTGNVTGNLTGNAAGNHTGTFKGDVDVSEGTLTLAPGQIHLAALNQDVIDYIILNSMPIGGIIPFHKDVVDIPANYSLCDGTNGTDRKSTRLNSSK